MKTKKILLVLASVICLAIFVGCGTKDKLVGNWVSEYGGDEMHLV